MGTEPPLAAGDSVHPFPGRRHLPHSPNRTVERTADALGGDAPFSFPATDAKHHNDGVLDVR
eukprot:2980985-Lingulodinium_polyedra.AAC.1